MNISNNKKLFEEILNAKDQNPMLSLQIQIMSVKNKTQEKDAKEAIDLYSKILKTKKSELYYFYRALNYGILNDTKMAMADYTLILKMNKNHVSALVNRGRLYFQSGDHVKAEKDFSKAIQIGADYMTYLSRAETHFHLSKFDKAMEDFETAIAFKMESERSLKNTRAKLSKRKTRK